MYYTEQNSRTKDGLYEYSVAAKNLIRQERFDECARMLCRLFSEFPDCAEPHNLYGILLEARRQHVEAMKHFRAACALEPEYLPAKVNLEVFGTRDAKGEAAYNEDDCCGGKTSGHRQKKRRGGLPAVFASSRGSFAALGR